jgi:adenylyltransferase/sulfurtransferase
LPPDVPAIPEVTVEEARAAHQEGALLLDVREADELAIARIDPCRHIPMREIPARLAELPADGRILVLCHVGGRSAYVTHFLRQRGFASAVNIAGGIDAWAERLDPSLARY